MKYYVLVAQNGKYWARQKYTTENLGEAEFLNNLEEANGLAERVFSEYGSYLTPHMIKLFTAIETVQEPKDIQVIIGE